MSNTYFTSDTHFFHSNVIKYSKRPFKHVDEMNEALIKNWNLVVRPGDTVYHLGDFSFGRKEQNDALLGQLNGHKHLIRGNHDKHPVLTAKGWASVGYYQEVTVDGQFLVLFHYGGRVWNKSHHGAIQLYGHSHGSLPGNSQSLDVGTDCWNYTPCTLAQIKERLLTLPAYRSDDHHQPRERHDDRRK